MPPKQSTSRSPSPAAKRGGAATDDEPMVPLKAVVVAVAICAGLVYLDVGGIKAPVLKKFCQAKCKFANRCDCDGDGRPDCIDLNTCDYDFAQCKAYYGSMHGWKMTEATILEFFTFVDADDFDVTLVPKVTALVLVAPQVDLACVEKHVKAGSPTSHAFAVCDCRGASGANAKECAEEMGSEGEYSHDDIQVSAKGQERDRPHSFNPEPTINPSRFFYYGGLYGEILTRTKYNTTLGTCDRFSTSSAAPPEQQIGCAAFSR
jgi:hypothetical protein